MKAVRIRRTLQFATTNDAWIDLREGEFYVMADAWVRAVVTEFGTEIVEAAPDVEQVYPHKYKGEPLDGKTLLLWRTGGIGDLLFVTPSLRLLKERYPTCRIEFGTSYHYTQILWGNPHVDEVFPLPVSGRRIAAADHYIHFENIIEHNKRAEVIPACDLFMEAFGIDPSSIPRDEAWKRRPVLKVDPEVRRCVEARFFPQGKPDAIVVAVQLKSSSVVRDYPPSPYGRILSLMVQGGYHPVLIGSGRDLEFLAQMPLPKEGFSNAIGRTRSLLEMAALIDLCDMVVGPDSSAIQIAGALEKPVVGLYGPFPPVLRMGYFKNAVGLQAVVTGKCNDRSAAKIPNGCFLHGFLPCPQSLWTKGWSPCFHLVDPPLVVRHMDHLVDQLGL